MKNTLNLVRINSNYCDYLRNFDKKVPYNFKSKSSRPFIGVLFEVNGCKYFAPLSSPKPKHLKIIDNIDFLRLDKGKLGAINFNNMIPVKNNNIDFIDLNKECMTRKEMLYQKLLKEQLYWLNRNSYKLYNRANKLYFKYSEGKLSKKVSDRCCNFPLLEEKCNEYNKEKIAN